MSRKYIKMDGYEKQIREALTFSVGGCGRKVGLNTHRKEIGRCIQMNNTTRPLRFMRKQNR